ncbi:hypothetical protein OG242_22345 [Streptomyces sp. NBC_00727]|uniref:hypothetical protein n=1 Tax=Streptomyces sp. NBC_00727 TaxID=2903675 RepID=UPI0038697692
MRVNRVRWAVVCMALAATGLTGCTSDPAASGPRPEDSGPITRAKMRLVLDGITEDVGAPANDPEVAARTETTDNPLGKCFVQYKGFDKTATKLDVDRARAVATALTDRGWSETKKRDDGDEASDNEIAVVRAVFKKRGWTIVMDYSQSSDFRVLSLNSFEDTCARKAQGTTPAG